MKQVTHIHILTALLRCTVTPALKIVLQSYYVCTELCTAEHRNYVNINLACLRIDPDSNSDRHQR
jgi:hypothetical protein